jgi:hypothetical protein
VEAGVAMAPNCTKIPSSLLLLGGETMGEMEGIFARFKNFNVLKYRFRHQIDLHQRCLLAVAVIVQIDMDCGHGLFDV